MACVEKSQTARENTRQNLASTTYKREKNLETTGCPARNKWKSATPNIYFKFQCRVVVWKTAFESGIFLNDFIELSLSHPCSEKSLCRSISVAERFRNAIVGNVLWISASLKFMNRAPNEPTKRSLEPLPLYNYKDLSLKTASSRAPRQSYMN